MKKFTSLSFMLIAALMMFSSCSKDDDGAPALDLTLLEGTWTITKTVYSSNGVSETDEESEGTYTFNADKTYLLSGFWDEEGTYAVSGNKITLTTEDESAEYEIKELTATNLTVLESYEMEFGGVSVKYLETIYLSKAE